MRRPPPDLSFAITGPCVKVRWLTQQGMLWLRRNGLASGDLLPLDEATIFAESCRDNGIKMTYEGKLLGRSG